MLFSCKRNYTVFEPINLQVSGFNWIRCTNGGVGKI